MTKLAELSVLGIYAPLHFFEYYHDDGYVDSIEDHFFMLIEKYGQEHQVSRDKIRKTLGGYLHYEGMFFSHHHIYYKRANEPDIFFIRGHEETHFLERIWKINLNLLLIGQLILERSLIQNQDAILVEFMH